jgi:hypothetical protein
VAGGYLLETARKAVLELPASDHPLILLRVWRPDRHGQQPEADRGPRQRPTWRIMAWNAGSEAIVLNGGCGARTRPAGLRLRTKAGVKRWGFRSMN